MKIIDIIKKWFGFKSNRTKMLEDRHIDNISVGENQRDLFIESINQKENMELKNLQKKLENNEISVNSLNIFKVMDLIDKYENEVCN